MYFLIYVIQLCIVLPALPVLLPTRVVLLSAGAQQSPRPVPCHPLGPSPPLFGKVYEIDRRTMTRDNILGSNRDGLGYLAAEVRPGDLGIVARSPCQTRRKSLLHNL